MGWSSTCRSPRAAGPHPPTPPRQAATPRWSASMPTASPGTSHEPARATRTASPLRKTTMIVVDSLNGNNQLNWSLTGPYGGIAGNRLSNTNGFDNGNVVITLQAGSYTFTVSSVGDGVGYYNIRLIDIAAQATAITPGTAVSGVLDPANRTAALQLHCHRRVNAVLRSGRDHRRSELAPDRSVRPSGCRTGGAQSTIDRVVRGGNLDHPDRGAFHRIWPQHLYLQRHHHACRHQGVDARRVGERQHRNPVRAGCLHIQRRGTDAGGIRQPDE